MSRSPLLTLLRRACRPTYNLSSLTTSNTVGIVPTRPIFSSCTICDSGHRPNFRPPAIPRALLAEYLRDASASDGDPMVKLVDSKGTEMGVMRRSRANVMAVERDMRLVECEPGQVPNTGATSTKGDTKVPIYKIVTSAELDKPWDRPDGAKSVQAQRKVKTLRLRAGIGSNMLALKVQRVNKWLAKGHKVLVQVAPSRAGVDNPQLVVELVDQIRELVSDEGTLVGLSDKLGEKAHTNFMIMPAS